VEVWKSVKQNNCWIFTMESFINSICSIAKDFRESNNKNMYLLVKERLAKQSNSSVNKKNIIECLKLNPVFIKSWLLYSEDKRSSSGWYIKENLNHWIIGYLDNGVIENEKVFESKYEACAEFIISEINSILQSNED